jgi:hypothetical protein
LLSLAISFLAGFLGLRKVTDKIKEVIQKVRTTVDKAIDAAITWIVTKAKALFARLFAEGQPDDRTGEQKKRDKLAAIADAEKVLPAEDFDEDQVRGKLGPIKSRYRLLTLNLVVDSKSDQTETVHFTATASDEEKGQPKQVRLAAAVPVTLVPVDSWINLVGTTSHEQVTSSAVLKRRTAAGVETPVSFQTAKPEGGGSMRYSYRDENTVWARTNFSHGSKLVMPVGGGQFKLIPAKRGREVIREEFYGDSQTVRDTVKIAKLPSLLNFANPSEFFSEASAADEIRFGHKRDPATGKALVPVSAASSDHRPAIAEHWTNQGGNNAVQTTRETWNQSPATYRIISGRLNSSLGSGGATYTDGVGITFRGPGE